MFLVLVAVILIRAIKRGFVLGESMLILGVSHRRMNAAGLVVSQCVNTK